MMDVRKALSYLCGYGKPLTIMEVCGTHTSAIAASGLRSLISPAIRLVSGPGCPICVAPSSYIDDLVDAAGRPGCVVACFCDMMRVRGTGKSLGEAKAGGASIVPVYSPLEALGMARKRPDATVVVAAVGFETTAPIYAVLLDRAREEGVPNIKIAPALKTMPPALDFICRREAIDAFICPGHVSTVIGCEPYAELCAKFGKPFVVAGFEPEHLVAAIYEIAAQHERGAASAKNLYPGAVSGRRQEMACEAVERYFVPGPAVWRGIGVIEDSGLFLRGEYAGFGHEPAFRGDDSVPDGCKCGDVLLGRISPPECPLYGLACTPEHSIGPCMVSTEGACGAWHRNSGE